MSVVSTIVGGLLRPVLEQQAKGKSFQELAHSLERTGKVVAERLESAANTPSNREIVNHVIGIERWGQRRLQAALGEAFVADSYDGYREMGNPALETLLGAFATTCRDTVELVRELEAAKVDISTKVHHNDLGALSIRGWLVYLMNHAKRESSRLKT